MSFVVTCEGPDIPAIAAKGAADALYFALDLVDLGYADVKVRTPDGEIYPIQVFSQKMGEQSPTEAQPAR